MSLNDPKYDRARKWIKENMNPSKYRTLQEFLEDAMKKDGFNKVTGLKSRKLENQISLPYEKKFTFKTDDELKRYIDVETKKLKEAQENLNRLKKAKTQDEIERVVKAPEQKITPPQPQGSVITRAVKSVSKFFKGLFGRK